MLRPRAYQSRPFLRFFSYEDTLAYRIQGPKATCMIVHPVLVSCNKPKARVLWEADEAIGLARAAKWDIFPGPTEPRGGWDERLLEKITAAQEEERLARGTEDDFIDRGDPEAESDDEYSMDDPIWNSDVLRKQWAESCLVRMRTVDAGFYFTKGKVEELSVTLSRKPVKYVFVNEQLTPAQVKGLEQVFNAALQASLAEEAREKSELNSLRRLTGYRECDEEENYLDRVREFKPRFIEVLDRQRVILEIFAVRAKTHEAKLQVNIARSQYMKTNLNPGSFGRMKNTLAILNRHVGAFQQIPAWRDEVIVDASQHNFDDTKALLERALQELRRELAEVKKARESQRRGRSNMVTIGLVGYTNAGKTELMNRLTGSNLRARNLLFQTLDTTVRRCALPSGHTALLTDSVGFVRGLPHFLYDAFRATVEELTSADIIVHVRDVAHPASRAQAETVRNALIDAGLSDADLEARTVEVWNKVDLLPQADFDRVVGELGPQCVPISARDGTGVDVLLHLLDELARRRKGAQRCWLPLAQGAAMGKRKQFLYNNAECVYEESLMADAEGAFWVEALITDAQVAAFRRQFACEGPLLEASAA